MKLLKYIFICSLVSVLAVSCDKGLDPIESVPAAPDASAPELVITYPTAEKPFVSPDEPAAITFKLVASDDAELKSVTLELDGSTIATFTSFMDYRRLDLKYVYNNMTEGDHTLIVTVVDLTDKSVTGSVSFRKVTAPVYVPLDGEVLYLPLDGFNLDLITGNEVTLVGAPGYAEGKVNDCYAGAADSYMTYPTTGLLGSEFGLSFWYKINADPLRAGIMAISPVGDSRNYGFRLFRENSGNLQNIGLNIGNGTTEVWMNPFIQVPVDRDWMHIAISISTTKATFYIDGAVVLETELTDGGINWTGCDGLTIASGMPNFVYWEHFSDLSLYDEIHMFKRAITAAEVQSFYAVKK
jgi:hypothetical protein